MCSYISPNSLLLGVLNALKNGRLGAGWSGRVEGQLVSHFLDLSPSSFHSPNRFTCEGFLLLLKGCMLGRMILSLSLGLCSWPHDFTLVSHLSPTCLPVSSGSSQCSGRMILYLSPICLHLSPSCLPDTCLPFVSHLSPSCLPISSQCSQCSGRMISGLSPICLPLVSQ